MAKALGDGGAEHDGNGKEKRIYNHGRDRRNTHSRVMRSRSSDDNGAVMKGRNAEKIRWGDVSFRLRDTRHSSFPPSLMMTKATIELPFSEGRGKNRIAQLCVFRFWLFAKAMLKTKKRPFWPVEAVRDRLIRLI